MSAAAIDLSQLRPQDAPYVGGKAANLGALLRAGFPVPPGFVVTAPVYRRVVDTLSLGADVGLLTSQASAETVARTCERIRQRLAAAALPPDMAAVTTEMFDRVFPGEQSDAICAVRSSATAEDLAGASFAGQHGTYYYVTRDQLIDMIRRCWASLWTAEAVAYRASRGIAHDSVAMAVVVQQMIPAHVSGVAFSVNPVTGDRSELVIESTWGMGAALVDGRVTPDRYLVDRHCLRVRERRVAEKRQMVRASVARTMDHRLDPVPLEMRLRETLGADDIHIVADMAMRCERHFGQPQDIEWALRDGAFYLLQSRPITTLDRAHTARPDPAGRYVLFKAIAENFTEPLTPLSADLLTAPFARAIGLRIIDGRIYADLAAWRRLVAYDLSDEQLARFLYSVLEVLPPHPRLSWRRLTPMIVAMPLIWLSVAPTWARAAHMPDDFMEVFRRVCDDVIDDPSVDPPTAFQRVWGDPSPLKPLGEMPLLVNACSMGFAAWLAILRRMLKRWAPDLRAETATQLCAGESGVLSARMGRDVQRLAGVARSVPAVARLLDEDLTADVLIERLRADPAAAGFMAALDEFLRVHGHRTAREFELQVQRWWENPAPVLGMVRNHLASDETLANARTTASMAASARVAAELRVSRAMERLPLERRLGLRGRLIGWAARRARYYFKLRENSRYYHIMGMDVVRRKVRAVERELLAAGRLRCSDDIFFLQWSEIQALRDGRTPWEELEPVLRERRLQHVRLSKQPPRRTIGVTIDDPRTQAAPDLRTLTGLSASPGCHEGIARVILDPSVNAHLRRGEILVAPYTDPAWTPLFLTAGAAVVEVGSFLSHAGTVAREYGMPCVVDVADCTRRIPNGARLLVDADRGEVRILELPGDVAPPAEANVRVTEHANAHA
jgi:rifampicin phosphotransferase